MSRNSESSSLTGSWVKLNQIGTTVGLNITGRPKESVQNFDEKMAQENSRCQLSPSGLVDSTTNDSVSKTTDINNNNLNVQLVKPKFYRKYIPFLSAANLDKAAINCNHKKDRQQDGATAASENLTKEDKVEINENFEIHELQTPDSGIEGTNLNCTMIRSTISSSFSENDNSQYNNIRGVDSSPRPPPIDSVGIIASAKFPTDDESITNHSFDVIDSNVSLIDTTFLSATNEELAQPNDKEQLDALKLDEHLVVAAPPSIISNNNIPSQNSLNEKIYRYRPLLIDPTSLFRSMTRCVTSTTTNVKIDIFGRSNNSHNKQTLRPMTGPLARKRHHRLPPPKTPPNTPTIRSEPPLDILRSPEPDNKIVPNSSAAPAYVIAKKSKTDCQVTPVSSSWTSVELMLKEAARDNIPYAEAYLTQSEWSSPLYPSSPYPELRDLKELKDTDWIWDWSNGVPNDMFGDEYYSSRSFNNRYMYGYDFYNEEGVDANFYVPFNRRNTLSLRNTRIMKVLLISTAATNWLPWLLLTNLFSLAIGASVGIYLGLQWFRNQHHCSSRISTLSDYFV